MRTFSGVILQIVSYVTTQIPLRTSVMFDAVLQC